jgi:hypothetical protein
VISPVIGVGAHFRGARRSFSNGNNYVSKSFVSVARLVMPIYWRRDEHKYMFRFNLSLSIRLLNVLQYFVSLENLEFSCMVELGLQGLIFNICHSNFVLIGMATYGPFLFSNIFNALEKSKDEDEDERVSSW